MLERLGEALPGDRVDPELWRGRYGLVAVLGQLGDELRADEPGAADDDDLHGNPPSFEGLSQASTGRRAGLPARGRPGTCGTCRSITGDPCGDRDGSTASLDRRVESLNPFAEIEREMKWLRR